MLTRGLCFETPILCSPRGSAAPPQILQNKCRNHLDAAFTDAPTWIQLPSGLWALQFVSAQTNYCTIPDIPELLGATSATWLAWVRKDAYIQFQCVASDYAVGGLRWIFGSETPQSSWKGYVGDNTTVVGPATAASVFTVGWHFVWMRFNGSSVTGLEAGCDNTVATPVSTLTVAALGTGVKNHTYIGLEGGSAVKSSSTLGALAIWASKTPTGGALSDDEISRWRESRRRLIGC
ncbi:MAG: hypothetical protein WC455_25245 [Dehalococcoidia bacterium]|jgi:hypothetical protein